MSNAPEGTIWFGGPVDRCSVTLRIGSDDLDPDEITALMGVSPTRSHRRGATIYSSDGKYSRICRQGVWSIEYQPELDADPELEPSIMSLLSQLPSDATLWSRLSAKHQVDLFCGLFLEAPNRGLTLSPDLMRYLGDRRIELGLDIYSPDFKTAFESFRKGPTTRRQRDGELDSPNPGEEANGRESD